MGLFEIIRAPEIVLESVVISVECTDTLRYLDRWN